MNINENKYLDKSKRATIESDCAAIYVIVDRIATANICSELHIRTALILFIICIPFCLHQQFLINSPFQMISKVPHK